ncbi:MAG: erythromycin esterase family protein [Gemmatimonadota bacterium]
MRWTGWVRVTEATGAGAGLWMRVDGPGVVLASDEMTSRRLVASPDWQQASVVLDVPQNALGMAVGALLGGPGDVIVDDFRLEIVGPDVPVTDTLNQAQSPWDSAYAVQVYALQRAAPVNLGFEGLEGPPQATVDYLRDAAVAFAGTDPAASDADLEPLRQMVGSARVVGLGEGTHGTREFFRMKHRILQYLVREMGFTVFAMEGTSPESDLVNDYVLEGNGDPAVLLSNLYFWTWNTQEVLDMIEWMRQWNLTAPADQRVRFRGFDMQAPGLAMDIVTAFIGDVDPANASFVADRFPCLADYRNHGHVWPSPATAYADLPASVREACRAGLQEVFDLLESHRADYEAASSPSAFAQALHSARLVQQFEAMYATTENTIADSRDSFMAENTLWLLDQAGPDARMVLWAHNGHVTKKYGAMGDSLAHALGDSYVNLAFLFGSGFFNAFNQRDPGSVQPLWTDYMPEDALEKVFLRTSQPRLLLDARQLVDGGPAAEPLRGPMGMRMIGAYYDPDHPERFFAPQLLPGFYDLLVYLENTTESTLLPFIYE